MPPAERTTSRPCGVAAMSCANPPTTRPKSRLDPNGSELTAEPKRLSPANPAARRGFCFGYEDGYGLRTTKFDTPVVIYSSAHPKFAAGNASLRTRRVAAGSL